MPQAVAAELRDPGAPAKVRAWVTALPPWCVIRPVQGPPDPALMWLDAGEREALMLMQEVGADALLIDDLDGRREARRRGIQVTGTLGILERAALRGLLDLPTAITRLRATTFHAPAEIIAAMLARHAERQSRSQS